MSDVFRIYQKEVKNNLFSTISGWYFLRPPSSHNKNCRVANEVTKKHIFKQQIWQSFNFFLPQLTLSRLIYCQGRYKYLRRNDRNDLYYSNRTTLEPTQATSRQDQSLEKSRYKHQVELTNIDCLQVKSLIPGSEREGCSIRAKRTAPT